MRGPLTSVVALFGGVLAAVTVLGLLGRLWWGLDLLANFRLQYAFVGLVLALVLAMLGSRTWMLIVLAVTVFNAALIAPLYLREPADPAGPERLEIVSFNTQLTRPGPQLDWILDHEPDLVFLFESSRVAEAELAETVDGYDVLSGIADNRNFGVTVLARTQLGLGIERLDFPEADGGAVLVSARIGDESVSVYGIHPPSPSNPLRATARDDFLAAVGRIVALAEGPRIVTGDFNATPWAYGFRLVAGPGGLINSQEGFGYSGTWPAELPALARIPLDHLIHSADLTVVTREVGPDLGTDHLPLLVEVAPA